MNAAAKTKEGKPITLAMMRDLLYSAVVCDALDSLGYTNQSPTVQLRPYTGAAKLVGRCKTTLCADVEGVVDVPQDVEAEALSRAWTKVHAENVTRDAIKAGMKAVAAYQKYGVL